jgi:hypothetical protein
MGRFQIWGRGQHVSSYSFMPLFFSFGESNLSLGYHSCLIGFISGRIGRIVMRNALLTEGIEVVAVNE